MKRRSFLEMTGTVLAFGAVTGAGGRFCAAADNAGLSDVGLVFDGIYFEPRFEAGHPENPLRLEKIRESLTATGTRSRLEKVSILPEAEQHLTLVHTPEHVSSILENYGSDAFDHATAVVGGSIAATAAVCKGQLRSVFCASRPPGHHATNTGRVEGFCFFNSVAIAARYAQQNCGLRRILVVDWDYHHGNGTETAFYSDPDVLFFSTHDYYAYPGTGDPARKGIGPGSGYNINVHLDCGAGDEDIIAAFNDLLVPAADAFGPELVIVSAGFDSRRDDLLGCFDITDDGFAELTRIVMGIADRHCDGRLVSVLEGGYNVDGSASAVTRHVQTLMKI